MTTVKVLSETETEEVIARALDAACAVVQGALGQTDGGTAGVFFSGWQEARFKEMFKAYVELEYWVAGQTPYFDLQSLLKSSYGMTWCSTGGGFSAFTTSNSTHYILLSDEQDMADGVTPNAHLQLGFYTLDGETVAFKEGRWPDLVGYIEDFVRIAAIPGVPHEGDV